MYNHISIVPTISATGDCISSLIIYKYIYTIPDLLAKFPFDSIMGFINSRYMQEDLFQKYIEHFISSILPVNLVLLILDGHKSHINYTSIKFCHNNVVLLYTLPSTPHMYFNYLKFPSPNLKKNITMAVTSF